MPQIPPPPFPDKIIRGQVSKGGDYFLQEQVCNLLHAERGVGTLSVPP